MDSLESSQCAPSLSSLSFPVSSLEYILCRAEINKLVYMHKKANPQSFSQSITASNQVVCCIFVQLHQGRSLIKWLEWSWMMFRHNWPKNAMLECMKLKLFVYQLPSIDLDFAGHQPQTASTASCFMTLGHGSPPNISGATVTVHIFCPTQSCKNTSCINILTYVTKEKRQDRVEEVRKVGCIPFGKHHTSETHDSCLDGSFHRPLLVFQS